MKDLAWPPWVLGLLLAVAILVAYSNSFHSPFTYDDYFDVLGQNSIRRLWPLKDLFYLSGKGFVTRPVVNVSFALNHTLGGARPFQFHLTNLAIHICASLALLGVVRRTLSLPVFADRFKTHLSTLSLVTAACWALHPLLTESVSYITQRYESIMALFVLCTFYSVLRSDASPRPRLWQALAILSCLLALGSKEVAISLPILVLLFDRFFLVGSFREMWGKRKLLHVGLILTWVPFLYIQLHGMPRPFAASSFTLPWWKYALNQPKVILHYLQLAVWPRILVFDYAWRAETAWRPLLPGLVGILVLLGFTLWALLRRPRLAFLPIFFMAILAPTSSIMPILDLAVEHRMYLPLAAVLMAGVLVGHALVMRLGRFDQKVGKWAHPAALVLLAMVIAALGIRTYIRNEDYRDPVDLWRNAALAAPSNPRAHNNYAFLLGERGNLEEAAAAFGKAAALTPQSPLFQTNYGVLLARLGKYEEGLKHARIAVQLEPGNANLVDNLGFILLMKRSLDNAATCFETALEIDPKDEIAYGGLASVYQAKGDLIKARDCIQKGIRLNPYLPGFQEHLGQILMELGDPQGARSAFLTAVRLQPSAEKISDLAWTMHRRGFDSDALVTLRHALKMVPDHNKTRIRLAWLLATCPDATLRNGPEAVHLAGMILAAQRPVRTSEVLDLWAVALAEVGRFPEARSTLREALAQSKDHQEAWVPSVEMHLALFEKNEPYREIRTPKPTPGDRSGASRSTASTSTKGNQ